MTTETETKRRKDLKAKLVDAFADAVGPDRWLSSTELQALGVPRKFASSVSRASRAAEDDAAAVNAATEWADQCADHLDAEDRLTPQELVDRVGRL